jgi:UDP-N-acetylmuramoyl-L-alanyl-D-glutamate--2,6-diaminopimelate ligase
LRVQLREVLEDTTVLSWSGDPSIEVATLVQDSRRVTPGACFACVPGGVTDGHDHAPAAVHAGAVGLLVERPLGLGVVEARVEQVRSAIGPAAARLLGQPSRALRCLGVTGTNGKTTVTHLLEGIATAAGERTGVIGTIGARVAGHPVAEERTTPEATELQELLARMRDADVGTVAMEVSSHALEQHRVDGTWFAAACFTNLSHDHLDYHGDLDAYFAAKAALFDPARTAVGVVNVDDGRGRELVGRAAAAGLSTRTFSVAGATADVAAIEARVGPDGSEFVLTDGARQSPVVTSLIGPFNLSNCVAAAATALAGGLPWDAVVAGLATPIVVPGRLEPVDAGQAARVYVDYAHTPDALSAVLAAVRRPSGRVIVVFGCGGDRDRDKRPLMGRAAARGADVAVLTNDNPRSEDPKTIADAVLTGMADGGADVHVELDRRAAIRWALEAAGPDDVVVVAGKGHEAGQTAAGTTVPFDDRNVAREEIEALACG